MTDDEIRQTIEGGQLKLQRERGTDLTIFSPRAAGMGHHLGDAATSEGWASACNELIHRVCSLFPKNFVGVAMLPQSARVSPKNCLPEIDRCVNQYGFVGINLNPTRRAATGRTRRCPTATGIRSTRRWWSTTSRR